MRKYRIVSKVRFAVFIGVMAMVMVAFATFVSGGIVLGETVPKYEIVKVQQGDTLWNIAEKYSDKNTDIRETIYAIEQANDLKPQDLMPGLELRIPVNL